METVPLLAFSVFALALGIFQLLRRKALAERANFVSRGGMSKPVAVRMSLVTGSLLVVLGLAGLVWAVTK